jgi:hypothetical protein
MSDIHKGQIWASRRSDSQVLIHQKVGGFQWKVKVLTNKTGVFNGTHTLTEHTLRKGFELLQ